MAARSRVLPLCEYPLRKGSCGSSAPHSWRGINLCCSHFTEITEKIAALVEAVATRRFEDMMREFRIRIRELEEDS
jgi:hypothetical protein